MKNHNCLFVDVALRAASILKNLDFLFYKQFESAKNGLICLDSSLRRVLELLVLKNAVDCTS